MSTKLDLDIAALVGEMEAPPCESLGHVTQPHIHDEGPATHYARVRCGECGINVVKSYCATFVARISSGENGAACFSCGASQDEREHFHVLGPVNK